MGVILLGTINTSEINPSLKETFAPGAVETQESKNVEIGLGLYWKQISNGLVYIASCQILRQAEFKRKLTPSSRPPVIPCTQTKLTRATTAQEKTQTESGRSKKGWSDKWFEGMVSVRGADPTTKSVHALPYCEPGRGRHQPDLSKAAKSMSCALGWRGMNMCQVSNEKYMLTAAKPC